MYVNVRMYVCTYVRMYVCTFVRMYVCTYVRMYVRMYVGRYVCMYDTHEHILYKMTGVKVCYILFYAPPAALLQGVTHPTL